MMKREVWIWSCSVCCFDKYGTYFNWLCPWKSIQSLLLLFPKLMRWLFNVYYFTRFHYWHICQILFFFKFAVFCFLIRLALLEKSFKCVWCPAPFDWIPFLFCDYLLSGLYMHDWTLVVCMWESVGKLQAAWSPSLSSKVVVCLYWKGVSCMTKNLPKAP